MPTVGPNLGGFVYTYAGAFNPDWVNPNNILLDDGSYAVCTRSVSSSQSWFIGVEDFGFAIDPADTILGITIQVKAKLSLSNAFKDIRASIYKLGQDGETQANKATNLFTSYGVTDTTVSYGGAADLWSQSWAPADVNSAGFGFLFQVEKTTGSASRTFSIDAIFCSITSVGVGPINNTRIALLGAGII